MMLVAALAAGLIQTAATPQPKGDPDDVAHTFVAVCVFQFPFTANKDDYVRNAADFTRKLAESGSEPLVGIAVDSASGTGCRVQYVGPDPDARWIALKDLFDRSTDGPAGTCRKVSETADRLKATCPHGDLPAPADLSGKKADLIAERVRSPGDGVTASLTNIRR